MVKLIRLGQAELTTHITHILIISFPLLSARLSPIIFTPSHHVSIHIAAHRWRQPKSCPSHLHVILRSDLELPLIAVEGSPTRGLLQHMLVFRSFRILLGLSTGRDRDDFE